LTLLVERQQGHRISEHSRSKNHSSSTNDFLWIPLEVTVMMMMMDDEDDDDDN